MVRDQIIYNVPGSLKFNIIKLDLDMLEAESRVKGHSMLNIIELDLTRLTYDDPRIIIDEVPRTSHLYTINRIKTKDGKFYTSYHKHLV